MTSVGFANPGVLSGSAGAPERDAALKALSEAHLEQARARVLALQPAYAVVELPGVGAVSSGAYQRIDGVAEIVGVATLAAARRQGRGAAVTLAIEALQTGATHVFLSAGSAAVARVYAGIGLRRVGTACIAEPEQPRASG